ncbi:MAG: bifunctional 5,10-methylenetetrahydrofolate dehydrogenase/5,10-methenyltetrahydrofolate cyclohydrolase [Candidatus Gracilibacteria bacterium]|nr:bifunctional 5,10-methylenetetrahydrofolate dehydrogenase/5,10-methenyltetrahydrofolate cyclohydrolase [Candidatus Gracilibacteria bacterium]MDD3119977.1 bifunctional 5,10-methylenetetrahydrofolate dehydrogenase/5,10-methenyltetrahydrofolate cyclohydrolase [Candidatus Gracilibacteria bacterium]MDD4530083.1 bifunctional 5,10-methylenetetrahydrofolate dehydrogenase/5,10-methenyltetrahydrofolate cyclohydrolase [Candidatus Gracilibacteria bacterium]
MIIDGKSTALKIYEDLKEKIDKLAKKPKLVVILVGENFASISYIKQKSKWAIYCGMDFELRQFSNDIEEDFLLSEIDKLNKDDTVTGFLVQLPLPKYMDPDKVINAIETKKDVDGFSKETIAKVFLNEDGLYPCTPKGIKRLLDIYNIDVSGKNVTIIGRSNIVGKPLALILINAGATVTVCNSKTKNLDFYTKSADIIVCAAGKPLLLKKEMVNSGSVIIDIGTNFVDGKMVGDADFTSLEPENMITPVPGGVGPMTVAMLIENTYLASLRN